VVREGGGPGDFAVGKADFAIGGGDLDTLERAAPLALSGESRSDTGRAGGAACIRFCTDKRVVHRVGCETLPTALPCRASVAAPRRPCMK
jgi:hypothetical protein